MNRKQKRDEKGFKIMRYDGFYSKHHKQKKHYHRLISKEQFINLKKLLYQRFLSLSSFNVDHYKG